MDVAILLLTSWYLLFIALLLYVYRAFNPWMSAVIPTLFIGIWILLAVLRALKTRSTVLTSDHPSFTVFESDDPHKSIIGLVDNAIKEQANNNKNGH